MLDKLSALLHLSPAGEWHAITGNLPAAHELETLMPMAQAKPAARKFAGGMAVTAPLGDAGWHFWVLSAVPGVSELPSLMTRLQDLSRGIAAQQTVGAQPARQARSSQADAVAQLLEKVTARVGTARKLKPKALAPVILDTLVELGIVDSAALVQWKGRRKPKIWLSDERLYGRTDELRSIAQAMRQAEPVSEVFRTATPEDRALELAVVARNLKNPVAGVVLPAEGQRGFGILGFGTEALDATALKAAVDLIALRFPAPPKSSAVWKAARRLSAAAAIVAGGWFLAQPAPTIITTVGSTEAADITLVTVPTDAYLTRMHVRVGDEVSQGALLAEFTSRTLDDALAEERLTATVEQLTAQAAFAENDISTFQLSTQRLEIVQERIAQLLARQEELRITAPVDGHIIAAMPGNVAGLFAQTGQEVAQIQTSDAMRVRMDLSRMDARLVDEGMRGTAYFRGLSQRSFDVEVLAPPTLTTDPETGASVIETTAAVAVPDGVIVGMTGFLRLAGPEAPRIVGYGRYVAEFVREKAWTYLGLQL